MLKKSKNSNSSVKKLVNTDAATAFISKYKKTGMIAGAAVVLILAAVLAIGALGGNELKSVKDSIESVDSNAAKASDLNIAVIRMDAIQNDAAVLKSLRDQRGEYEEELKEELTDEQKDLEEEKEEIEKSQSMLSQEALQRRVAEYQNRIGNLQRDLAEKAQSIEAAYQETLMEVQTEHLDPIIEGIINKKDLSFVMDGRFVRLGDGVEQLDITQEVIDALNKRIKNVKMETPEKM